MSSSEFDRKTGGKRKAGRQGQEKRSRRARPRRKRVTRPRNSKNTTSRSYWDSISNRIVKLFLLSPRHPGRESEGSVSEEESDSEAAEMQNRFVALHLKEPPESHQIFLIPTLKSQSLTLLTSHYLLRRCIKSIS